MFGASGVAGSTRDAHQAHGRARRARRVCAPRVLLKTTPRLAVWSLFSERVPCHLKSHDVLKSHDFVLPLTPRAHVAIKQEPFTIRDTFGIGE